MKPIQSAQGRSVKIIAAARTVSGIIWIITVALAFGTRKPLPIWIILLLGFTSGATLFFLGLWKRMTGKTVLDRTFGGFVFL